MNEGITWRLISDYIGAGEFLLSANRAFVGTEYGVQCLPYSHESLRDWKTQLGSRCISVRGQGETHLLATCRQGVYLLTREGEIVQELTSIDEHVHPALPAAGDTGDDSNGRMYLSSGTSLQFRSDWKTLAWEFDYLDILGKSVQAVRLINLFQMGDDQVVVGVVDYDSGLGRVVVLDSHGKASWMSEPGPVSELFRAGEGSFVWCMSAYGKFETRLTALDGRDIWRNENMAGVGRVLPNGSFAMLVGSNESPRWDNWELRLVESNGEVIDQLEGRGRCAVRPLLREDGSLIFIGSALHLDPSSSRVDYTNFLKMPQESLFQHQVGFREQLPEYEVYVHKLSADRLSLDVIYHVSGSYSLAQPLSLGKHIVFCDGRDIIGIET